MKIKVEFDITPAELRESLGLPDVSGLQEEVIEALQTRLKDTVENYDPTSMIKGWVEGGIGTVGEVQRAITGFLGKATSSRVETRPRPKRRAEATTASKPAKKKTTRRKKKT